MIFDRVRTNTRAVAGILRDTGRAIDRDNCLGLAAQLAYYFLLALFPALLFLIALVAYVPLDDVTAELFAAMGAVTPPSLLEIIRRQVDQIASADRGTAMTLGAVGALWSSSAAMASIITALNRAYGVTEWRPWWRRRLLAVFLTMALMLFTIVAVSLLAVGPRFAGEIAARFGLAHSVAVLWAVARWPAMVACVILVSNLVYHIAPNRRVPWSWITPGSVVATAVWIAGSIGLKFYLVRVAHVNATYGAIGGVIAGLLWFYVSGLSLLIGAEVNATIALTSTGGTGGTGAESRADR